LYPVGIYHCQSKQYNLDISIFLHQHTVEAQTWHKQSNYLAFLTVADEAHLIKLITKAILTGIKHTIFREPDLNNQITSVAFEPSEAARKLTSSCPLLGKIT
jgi:hypothetical protein